MCPDTPTKPHFSHPPSSHFVNLLSCPGETRNKIYDVAISSLPRTSSLDHLPDSAFVSTLIHREFMSKFLPMSHFNIRSMADIWSMHTIIDIHSGKSLLNSTTRLTITDFTAIAHTQTRASKVMDFLCLFENLDTLRFDVALDDLFHGLLGRVKTLEHFVSEFELRQISGLGKLNSVIINVKRNGIEISPGVASLLSELEGWFKEDLRGDVVFLVST